MKSIQFIKDEFSKASPILYKYKGYPLHNLMSRDFNRATDITLTQDINECAQLEFTVLCTEDRKIDYNSNEMLIYFNKIWFIIKDIDTDINNYTIKVTCQEMSCVLKGIYCEELKIINETASSIFSQIATSTGYADIGFRWLGTDVSDNIKRHLIEDKETSVYENLVNLAKNFNGSLEISYDTEGIGYIYIRTQPISTGKFVKNNIDIKTLSITSSSNEIYSRLLPTGYTDDSGEVLDIQSVNGGSSILEDFTYYKAMGIPDDIITKDMQYKQIKTFSDDKYTDANDLLQYAKEELAKCSKPQFTADCTILDLACYIDMPIEHPKLNMQLKIIDKRINFIFDCLITGIQRNFNNPLETKLTISNIIPYTTSFQSLQTNSSIVDKVVTTTNGTPTVNVNYMSGILNAQNTSLIGTVDNTTPSSSQSTLAILFEDKRIGYPAYGAMGFGTKGICIAKELNQDGTWKWQTFGDVNGFNASLIKTGILKDLNGKFSLDLTTGQATVPTQILTTSDKQIANTEFVTNKLNERQNVIVGTISSSLTNTTGDVDLTIVGLGMTPVMMINGDYINNTAQVVGVTNKTTDIITVHYINGTIGNCKFNYTYSK